jgi:hypothetical protein
VGAGDWLASEGTFASPGWSAADSRASVMMLIVQ